MERDFSRNVPRYYKCGIFDERLDSTFHHEEVAGSHIDVIEMQLQCHMFWYTHSSDSSDPTHHLLVVVSNQMERTHPSRIFFFHFSKLSW